ncbi:fatty acid synthase-like isoform X2 [Aphidius gifuensis]|nr:fatty acid synthase-like isoform X2 [Aphidius gifuensis]
MNLGKLYNADGRPDFTKLYQTINYPVGRGTPMINSMIGWDHSIEWAVADFSGKSGGSGETIIKIDLSKDEHSYISGHTIDGRILFPATGYLTFVWKTFAKLHNTDYEKLPITFENVQFYCATIMPKEGPVRFLINIFDGTGDFEICEGGSPAVTGKIFESDDPKKDQLNNLPIPSANNTNDVDGELLNLNKTDIYKDLRLRSYDYGGIFQGIKTSNNHGNTGELVWNNDWISFMDTMLQYSILGGHSRDLYLPVRIQYAAINPIGHYEMLKNNEIENSNDNDVAEVDAKPSEKTLNVYSYKNINLVKCGGVKIRGMKASLASRRQQTQSWPKHEKYVFIPYENNQILVKEPTKSRLHALTVMLQTVIENLNVLK